MTTYVDTALLLQLQKVAPIFTWEEATNSLAQLSVLMTVLLVPFTCHPTVYKI